MSNSKSSTDIEVSGVVTKVAEIVDDIPELLIPKCKSEDEESATERANAVDNISEPLISEYDSFDNVVVSFNKDFHGVGNINVSFFKLIRLVLVLVLFVSFLVLEVSLIFNMINILYKFAEESVFLKIAEISKQNYIYLFIILFGLLSVLTIYTVKKSIYSNFEKRILEKDTYLSDSGNKELTKKIGKDINEGKGFWIHSIFSNKELDSKVVRFESNYGSKYPLSREIITIPKIFKVIIPIAITIAANYLINSNLNMDSKKIVSLSLLTFLGIVSIIFIGFVLNFYREFVEELLEIFTPKNKVTELRYKRFISALRKANLIKVYKK